MLHKPELLQLRAAPPWDHVRSSREELYLEWDHCAPFPCLWKTMEVVWQKGLWLPCLRKNLQFESFLLSPSPSNYFSFLTCWAMGSIGLGELFILLIGLCLWTVMTSPGLYWCVWTGRFHFPLWLILLFVYTWLLGTIQSEIGEINLQSVENVARKETEERIITEDFSRCGTCDFHLRGVWREELAGIKWGQDVSTLVAKLRILCSSETLRI